MEEKIFAMMEKMYSEMQNGFKELREGQDGLEKRMNKFEKGMNKFEKGQTSLIKQVAQIENDLKPKVEAALDGYKVVYEKLEVLENKVDKLAETVESHDVKIEVIRKAK